MTAVLIGAGLGIAAGLVGLLIAYWPSEYLDGIERQMRDILDGKR